jgi:uncharacterized DUF497 family protein
MQIEWDENKRKSNIRKHGLDFIDAAQIFEGDIVSIEDTRYDYGESRFITLGLLNGIVIVVVHTETEAVIRIISARKASKYEEINYYTQIAD